jgi:hypothetical protein
VGASEGDLYGYFSPHWGTLGGHGSGHACHAWAPIVAWWCGYASFRRGSEIRLARDLGCGLSTESGTWLWEEWCCWCCSLSLSLV